MRRKQTVSFRVLSISSYRTVAKTIDNKDTVGRYVVVKHFYMLAKQVPIK